MIACRANRASGEFVAYTLHRLVKPTMYTLYTLSAEIRAFLIDKR